MSTSTTRLSSFRRAIGGPVLSALLISAFTSSTAEAQSLLAQWDFTNATSGTTAGTSVDVGLGATVLPNTEVLLDTNLSSSDMIADSIWNGDPCSPNGLQWSGGNWVLMGELNLQKWDGDVATSCGTNHDGNNDNYVAFTLTATSGTIDFDTVTIEAWRNGAGAPSKYGIDVVVDGGTPVPFGSRIEDPVTGSPSSVVVFNGLVTGATTVEFRFVPADGTASSSGSGNVHIDGWKVELVNPIPTTPIADWDFTNAANPAHGTGAPLDIGLGVSVLANTEVALEAGLSSTDIIADSIWNGDACLPNGLQWSAGNSIPTGELNIQKWDGDVATSCGVNNDGINDNYIGFTLDASPGTVDIDGITVEAWRNGGGAPSLYGIDVVVDGGAPVQFGSRIEDSVTGAPSSIVNFADVITGATTVEIRFVPADGTASTAGTGNLHIDGLSVYGAVVAVPPCADDSYEDNDTCDTAAAASVGLTTGLVVAGDLSSGGIDDDWFSISVDDGWELQVDTLFATANGDMDLRIYDATIDCSDPLLLLDTSGSTSDNESVSWTNTTGATATVVIYNFLWAGDGECQTYDMDITLTAPVTCVDDANEDNDDCATALPGTLGTTTDLVVYGNLGPTGAADDDWFTFVVPDGEYFIGEILFTDADGDMDLRLYDITAGCPGTQVDSSGSVSDNEDVSWQNTTGAPATVAMYCFLWNGNGDCQTYDLVASTSPCGADDFLEDNDTCDTAVTLSGTSYTDLVVYGDLGPTGAFDDDWYKVTVADGNQLVVDITFLNVNGDIDLALVDLTNGDCATGMIVLDYPGSITDNESVSYNNVSGADVEVGIKVWLYYAATTDCASYDMTVAQLGGPCLLPDDIYEDNEDCLTAAPLAPGVYPGLWVSSLDGDNYSFTVPAGMQVDAMASWAGAGGEDIDLWLWEAANAGCGVPSGTGYLARAYTTSNPESFSWVNTTGVDVDVVLLVDEWGSGLDCAVYDLEFSLGYPPVGTVMCVGDGSLAPCPCANDSVLGAGEGCVNSTGVGAITAATGTTSVVDDNMVFTLSQATAAELAVLVQGTASFIYPFRDGIYCMSNPTERMEFITTDGSGTGATTISIVTVGAVVPGTTNYYQWYYRDVSLAAPCGGGGNFANGLEVIWQP